MFSPKIIFFDIDETLWQKDLRRIPDSTQVALKKLRERGIITAIATGRTIAVLPEPIGRLVRDCGMEMLVSINGQYVEYQGKNLVSFPIEPSKMAALKAACQAHSVAYAFVSRTGVWASAAEARLLAATAALNVPFEIDPDYDKNHEVYQMLAFYPAEMDTVMAPMIPEGLRPIRWHENGVDFLDAHGSKARGIQAALAALGLEMGDAMAFGDELNDLEMIQAVGFGVAMGNAVQSLKDVADYVAPKIDEDGIYQALKSLKIID